jgi:hypothetical protein
MSASNSVQLPEHILTAARNEAEQLGLPVEDWVAVAVAEHLNGAEAAQEFFRNRAAGARRGALREALDAVPDRQLISATNSNGW